MTIEVERHRDRAMSKEVLHHLWMGALFQQERRCRVSLIVHAQSGKARTVEVVMKRGIYAARIQRSTGQRREYEAMLTPGFTRASPHVFNRIPVRFKHVNWPCGNRIARRLPAVLGSTNSKPLRFCRCTLRCTVATPRTKST